ncbi:MAG: RecQ family ATP-dependent DNA helicase [Bacteroidota bacterium]
MTPKEILKEYFGFDDFRPGQEEIIQTILSGKNVLAVLPTSGGKSICYQVPALSAQRFSIVVSPLIALMKDQVDSLNKSGSISAFINSSLDFKETEKVLNQLSQNKIKILYVSPERLDNLHFPERMRNLKPDHIFIDEAHCISEWGHNFRPSYRKIKKFIEYVGIQSISAFTATATEDVRNDIINQLGIKDASIFVRGFERNNLLLNVIRTDKKKEELLKIIKKQQLPLIIYAATRRITEEITDYLRANKIEAVYYHAGLSSELRRIIQDDFQSDRIKIIAATNAFGMGIDKSNIRTVIHFNLPPSIENYYQEIGRAGRDGGDSNIFLLYDKNDKQIQEYFINNSYPSREQIETVYNILLDYAGVALGNVTNKEIILDNDFNSLMNLKAINKNSIENSIKVLQESGYINYSEELRKRHLAQFIVEPNKLSTLIKSLDDNEIKDLIIYLVREYGSTIFHSKTAIDLNKISKMLEEDVDTVLKQLNLISQTGIILYTKPSLFPSIRLIKPRIPVDKLELNYLKIKELSKHNFAKLERMIDFVGYDNCRFKFILNYFGELQPEYRCNKCDNCRGVRLVNNSEDNFIEEHILSAIENFKGVVSKKDLINCLLGKSTEYKYLQLTEFGSCAHHSKKEIENVIARLLDEGHLTKSGSNLSISKKISVKKDDLEKAASNLDYEIELELYNTLRQMRQEASIKYSQPPQLICTDEILREIAKAKPGVPTALFEIKGFNQRIMNKIGTEILSIINEHETKNKLRKHIGKNSFPDNIYTILDLVKKKYSLEDICKLTKLPESVVSIQIETLINSIDDLETEYIFNKDERDIIKQKLDEGINDLKELRSATEGKISYAKLRIAIARRKITG